MRALSPLPSADATIPTALPAHAVDPSAGRATSRGSDYADLSRRVKQAGLFARRPGAYSVRAATLTVSLVAGWGLFVALGASWWQLAVGALLGALSTQVGFLGHDVGHRQVFRTRRASYAAGLLLANVGIGLSYGWWLDKHNRHHAHPNDLDRDPDVAPGALVFDASQAARRRGAARWLTRHQAFLFFPMLLLEGLNLHVASARALRSSRTPGRWLEGSLLAAHLVAYLGIVALVLPLGQALAFVAVQQGTFGLYMGLSFAPNHKGMPMERAGDNWDYLRRQVLTSRNVAGGPLVDRLLGGLNYQIEHHLFPSLPAPSLRHVQPLVRAFCAERGLPYCETSLVASFRQVLGHLDGVTDLLDDGRR
jgi:fatty acid desaturase